MLFGKAASRQGAGIATWIFGSAAAGAKIHHGLVELSRGILGNQSIGQSFKFGFGLATADVGGDAKVPGEYPEDISVYYGLYLTEGKARDRCSRIATYTLELE